MSVLADAERLGRMDSGQALSHVLTCLEHPVPVYSCRKTGPGTKRGKKMGWGVGLGSVARRGRNDGMEWRAVSGFQWCSSWKTVIGVYCGSCFAE